MARYLPESRAGKVTIAVFVMFMIAMNPPVIGIVDAPVLIAGIDSLYLWTVVWGIFVSLVFVWAAWRDAFALTEAQVPPELRDEENVTTTQSDADSGDSVAGGRS